MQSADKMVLPSNMLWPLCCLLCACSTPASSIAQERSVPRLSVIQVYKKHVTDSKSGYLALRGAFALGGGQLLLESDDHHLFMCDAETGNILWTHSVGELISDKAHVDSLHKDPHVLGACLDGDSLGLLLVFVSDLHAEYVVYNRPQNTVHRVDLAKVMNAQNVSIRRIEIKDARALVPQGLWYDTTMALIDLKTGGLIRRLKPKPAKHEIVSMAFSVDGQYVAATGDSVYVWDLKTGERLNDAYQPSRAVIEEWLPSGGYAPETCAFSPDSRFLAVVTAGGELLVFEVATGGLVVLAKTPERSTRPQYVRFLDDSGYLLVAVGHLHIYDLPQRKWIAIDTFSANSRFVPVGGIDARGRSIFVCDYAGDLRRFDWSVDLRK